MATRRNQEILEIAIPSTLQRNEWLSIEKKKKKNRKLAIARRAIFVGPTLKTFTKQLAKQANLKVTLTQQHSSPLWA